MNNMTPKPDEIVAEKITREFLKYGLIGETEIADFTRNLSGGHLSLEDWERMAELIIRKAGGTEDAQTT